MFHLVYSMTIGKKRKKTTKTKRLINLPQVIDKSFRGIYKDNFESSFEALPTWVLENKI